MKNWWEKKDKWFDCYLVLGVKEDATEEEIKHAYHELVKKYHPDLASGNREMFDQIQLAYDTLSDKETRKRYTDFSKIHKEKIKKEQEQEKELSFEEIVQIYKEKEAEIKISIAGMIYQIEKKEEKFTTIYNSFLDALKESKMSENDFEIRRQKLRSLELSSINSIKEIEDIIRCSLQNMNLDYEKKRLKKIKDSLKEKESILTSSYKEAIAKLTISKIKPKFKIPYVAMIPIFITLVSISLMAILYKGKNPQEDEVVVADIGDEELSEETNIDNENINEEIIEDDSNKEVTMPHQPSYVDTSSYSSDCILFAPLPEDIEFVEYSNVYLKSGRDVYRADDEFGTSYLFDANTGELLMGNYISNGGPYHDDKYDTPYLVVLGADGYDYDVAANLSEKRVLGVESTYSRESEPYYLEGYGYVIEAWSCGEKYLIDAETRFPFIRNFDEYGEMYYDEELGCNVYCFSKYDGESKYYLEAEDLRKVLKIENSWDQN